MCICVICQSCVIVCLIHAFIKIYVRSWVYVVLCIPVIEKKTKKTKMIGYIILFIGIYIHIYIERGEIYIPI